MKKVLYLPLKTEWYRMIESGEKPEEYREITDFWFKRLVRSVIDGKKYIKIPWDDITPEYIKNGLKKDLVFEDYTHAELSLGYPKKEDRSKRMTKEIESISIGMGNPKWGAPDHDVFIIKFKKSWQQK